MSILAPEEMQVIAKRVCYSLVRAVYTLSAGLSMQESMVASVLTTVAKLVLPKYVIDPIVSSSVCSY